MMHPLIEFNLKLALITVPIVSLFSTLLALEVNKKMAPGHKVQFCDVAIFALIIASAIHSVAIGVWLFAH